MIRFTVFALGLFLVVADLPAQQKWEAKPEASSCVSCHSQLWEKMAEPVNVWEGDVHGEAGIGCVGCHGGDPSPAMAEDMAAMAPQKGFRPAPDRLAVPDFCGHCHSDLNYMRRFNPQARVDQLDEYRTSLHGQRNAEGDPGPATCIDCHGSHGIRRVSSPASQVFPANVPEMCATCHSDPKKMGPYGFPIDQLADYRRSVHGVALLERGDLGAPACNDCHGNHGAAPPGVSSVANVCGQCHGIEGKLFRTSFKKELFDEMEVGECTVCHGNHRVLHPTPELFRSGSEPMVSQGKITAISPLTAQLGTIEAGQTAELSWNTVLAIHSPDDGERLAHRVEVSGGGLEPFQVDATVMPGDDPSVANPRTAGTESLSARLSIEPLLGPPVEAGDALLVQLSLTAGSQGATDVTVRDLPGLNVHTLEGSVCLQCHALGDECDQATERMYGALLSMDRDLRRAGTMLRRAEIAGVEVSEPLFELRSSGTTAAIESRSLIHSFDPDRLIQRTEEGHEVARAALAAAETALQEVEHRRKWLAVSLVFVALVLLGLYLKIRELNRERGLAEGAPA